MVKIFASEKYAWICFAQPFNGRSPIQMNRLCEFCNYFLFCFPCFVRCVGKCCMCKCDFKLFVRWQCYSNINRKVNEIRCLIRSTYRMPYRRTLHHHKLSQLTMFLRWNSTERIMWIKCTHTTYILQKWIRKKYIISNSSKFETEWCTSRVE